MLTLNISKLTIIIFAKRWLLDDLSLDIYIFMLLASLYFQQPLSKYIFDQLWVDQLRIKLSFWISLEYNLKGADSDNDIEDQTDSPNLYQLGKKLIQNLYNYKESK